MASNPNPNHQRNHTAPHQSIPLRDLNHRPPDDFEYAPEAQQRHRRTLSDRGRNLITTGHWNPQYAPIAEQSPSPTRHGGRPPRLDTFTAGHGGTTAAEDGGYSPLDQAAFQAAIGFFPGGSDFEGETSPPIPTPMSSEHFTPNDPYAARQTHEDNDYFGGSSYADTARLTDQRNLQPISGTAVTPPGPGRMGHARDRSSFQSVRFLTPEATTPQSRLGDDIANVEAATGGLRTSTGRKRSLSPSGVDTLESPLRRAGTIMRNMSQRVVNISNEPEVAERTMRRKSSLHQSRLEGPPSFPGMPEFIPDVPPSPLPPVEKPPSPVHIHRPSAQWQPPSPNPLRGKSLGIFPADSKLRIKLCNVLVHPVTEPLLLLLIVIQTVLLAVDASSNVFEQKRSVSWGDDKTDYALLVLFIIYTIEIIVRVIVSGFIINPVEHSTINRQVGLREAVLGKTRQLFGPQRQPSLKHIGSDFDPQQPSVLRAFTAAPTHPSIGLGDSRSQQRARLARRAYLRHSFNRTDFLAVVAFWISFFLSVFGVEHRKHILIFRMLSCLRIIRLLNLTSGTSVILRSLKKAAPLLVNVAFLISFFWLLFAIVGVQSFKSSFRRYCVWIDPLGVQNYTTTQPCGGWLNNDSALTPMSYIPAPGAPEAGPHKGFLCPVGSVCQETGNPYDDTQSFDNILQSLELVFVVMSSNTWSDLLYHVANSDYLIGAAFFAAGIVILSLWLLSLLIAVITSSFQIIREESKTSAFTGQETTEQQEEESSLKRRVSSLKRVYNKTKWIWIVVIAYGLICQSLRSAEMSHHRAHFIDVSETIVTLILLAEILIRFVVDWRHFFYSKRNITDLVIAIITTVIQIPPVKNARGGRAYAWLSFFQIVRIYRVVLAVPMTRDLIVSHSRSPENVAYCSADDRLRKRQRSPESDSLRVSACLLGFNLCCSAFPWRNSTNDQQ